MVQEIAEELAKLLRERGPIGSSLDKFERQAKIPREYIVYGVGSFVILMFLLNIFGYHITMLITTGWGFIGSIRALDKRDMYAMQKWTCYWVIYGAVTVLLSPLVNLLGIYFRKIYFLECLLLCWCAAPLEYNGSELLFSKLFAYKLFQPTSLVAVPPVPLPQKKAPPTMAAPGDVYEVGMRSPPKTERRKYATMPQDWGQDVKMQYL